MFNSFHLSLFFLRCLLPTSKGSSSLSTLLSSLSIQYIFLSIILCFYPVCHRFYPVYLCFYLVCHRLYPVYLCFKPVYLSFYPVYLCFSYHVYLCFLYHVYLCFLYHVYLCSIQSIYVSIQPIYASILLSFLLSYYSFFLICLFCTGSLPPSISLQLRKHIRPVCIFIKCVRADATYFIFWLQQFCFSKPFVFALGISDQCYKNVCATTN